MNKINIKNNLIIKNFSLLLSTTLLYPLYKKQWFFLIPHIIPFYTTRLYWEKPITHSTRYYIDVYCVKICLLYNILFTRYYYTFHKMLVYYSFVTTGLSCYGVSEYMVKYNKAQLATFFHCMLHLFANIGNVYLYHNYPTNRLAIMP